MKKFINRTNLFILVWMVLPILAFAQTKPPAAPTDFKDTLCIFVMLVLDFIPYVVVIAIGAFLMGLIKYVANGDNEEKRSAGTKMMVYGIVGFFFMIGIWGILELFVHSFNLQFGIPQLKQTTGAYQDFSGNCQAFYIGGE